ncbi:MAG: AcrR family transcriptional regulator [Kiritimatiellia bacterium]|jgi:AcrR family transcriptional regulator
MSQPSRREKTRRENHATLVRAARTVFADVGYENATIQEIVRHSELSRGTFYNYMGDKETAFQEVATELLLEVRAQLLVARADATSSEVFIDHAFRAIVTVLTRDAQTLALVTHSGAHLRRCLNGLPATQQITDDLENDFHGAMAIGLLPQFPVQWMTAAMLGATIEVCTRLELGQADEAGDFLSALFLSGVAGFRKR